MIMYKKRKPLSQEVENVLYVKKIYLADIEFDNGGTVEVVELQEDWHFQILTSV